jgi:hypothetical protein
MGKYTCPAGPILSSTYSLSKAYIWYLSSTSITRIRSNPVGCYDRHTRAPILMSSRMACSSAPQPAQHEMTQKDTSVLLYSVSSRQSFVSLVQIHEMYSQPESLSRIGTKKPVMIVASDIDLPPNEWQVTTEEGNKLLVTLVQAFAQYQQRTT